jgi:uncharacterized membrane protein
MRSGTRRSRRTFRTRRSRARRSRGSRVENAGVVRFDSRDDHTDIEVAFEYDPPAGTAGEVVATMFENPEAQVEDALERFKEIVETW